MVCIIEMQYSLQRQVEPLCRAIWLRRFRCEWSALSSGLVVFGWQGVKSRKKQFDMLATVVIVCDLVETNRWEKKPIRIAVKSCNGMLLTVVNMAKKQTENAMGENYS